MKALLNFLSGLSLPTLLLPLVFSGLLLTAGCSGTQALKQQTGGGPNIAANTQAGKTNTQTLGTSTVMGDQKIVRPKARTIKQSQDSNKVQADKVETVVVNEIPTWIILLLVIGWLFPSPGEMMRNIRDAFRKKL